MRHPCSCSFEGCGADETRDLGWTSDVCGVLASAAPHLYGGGKTTPESRVAECMSAFTVGGTRQNPELAVSRNNTTRPLPGRTAAADLIQKLQEDKIEDALEANLSNMQHRWTEDRLRLYQDQRYLSKRQVQAITVGLRMATFLNSQNKLQTWQDDIRMLKSGEFHRSHFPPTAFVNNRGPKGKLQMSVPITLAKAVHDVVRSPRQAAMAAVERQRDWRHATLYPPTRFELKALSTYVTTQGDSRRAKHRIVVPAVPVPSK